ncbi:uncharacterized protein TM35_000731170, partial [Trypanosoma theileri]
MLMRRLLYLIAFLLSFQCVFVVAGEPAKAEASHSPGLQGQPVAGDDCSSGNTLPKCKTVLNGPEDSHSDCGNPPEKEGCSPSVPKTAENCTEASEGTTRCSSAVGLPAPPQAPPLDSASTASCNTDSGVPAEASCPTNVATAAGAGAPSRGTLHTTQGTSSGGADGARGSQEQLDRKGSPQDTLPGSTDTLTSGDQ